jgi:hypothetical protein
LLKPSASRSLRFATTTVVAIAGAQELIYGNSECAESVSVKTQDLGCFPE